MGQPSETWVLVAFGDSTADVLIEARIPHLALKQNNLDKMYTGSDQYLHTQKLNKVVFYLWRELNKL